jgi:hypothetical protein
MTPAWLSALSPKTELGTRLGTKTIASLLALGLIEAGPNARHYDQIGWRLADDGWRCLYGETIAKIMAKRKEA